MVGPRSPGCRTCVRRKVRCDGTRPRCTRCQKAGFLCAGYTPLLTFMPPMTTEGNSSTLSGLSRKYSKQHGTNESLPQDAESQVVVSRAGELSFSMPGLDLVTPLNMALSNYTDDSYCIFFLDRYFCFDNWNDDLQSNKAWFWRALQSPSQYPVSNLASRALTTAFFARAHGVEHLHRSAYHLHGLALKAMVSQMGKPDVSFDVLSANALLGLYEACSCTSQNGWLSHIRAMRTLYQNVGPEFFRSRPARSLLMMCRFSIITEALISREKCFLTEEKWANLLTSDDREAALTVELGDIVIELPGMFQGVKQLERSSRFDGTGLQGREIFLKLLNHLAGLRKWWYRWCIDPRRMPERVPVTKNTGDLMRPPPSCLEMTYRFCNLEAAAGWCRYHAHVSVALRWLQRLLDLRLPGTIPHETCYSHPDLLLAHDGTGFEVSEDEIRSHALAVCDGLHFYTLPRYRHIGAVYMNLPAYIAWKSLPSGSPGSRWIEELMEFMATHSGFAMPGQLLRSIEVND